METVGGVIVAVGFSLLSSVIGGRKKAPFIGFDEQPTATAERGAQMPTLLGRRRVTPNFLWAGDRSRSGGGGKGGRGGGASTYAEAAWHGLTEGPCDRLHAIWVGETKIYTGPIARTGGSPFASGSSLTTVAPHAGTLYWHWGENNQPVNTRLAQGSGHGTLGVGIASRWPGLCYGDYRRLTLGSGPAWPNLQYELEKRCPVAGITSAADWIDETTPGAGDDGVNWAHALWTSCVLGGIPCDRLLCPCFNEIADVCEAERVPVNLLIPGGASAQQAIAALLQDVHAMMPEWGGKIAPRALREVAAAQVASLPLVSRDVWGPGPPIPSNIRPAFAPTRTLYTFPDRTIGERAQPIRRDADAASQGAGQVTPRVVQISSVTHAGTAAKLADLRANEDLGTRANVRMEVGRAAVNLLPGDQFRLETPGAPTSVCMVTSMARSPGSPSATMSAVKRRVSSLAAGAGAPAPPGTPAPGSLGADLIFVPQELPWAIARPVADPRLGVLRVRASAVTLGAEVLGSLTSSGYATLGENNGYAFGGTLDATLALGATIIGQAGDGPVITQYGPEMNEAEDLSASTLENDWLAGRQLALIGEGADAEIVFVRSVTSLGGGQWRLNHVVRGRMDTDAKAWASGTPVLFFGPLVPSAVRVTPIAAPAMLAAGLTVNVKSVPFSAQTSIDPATVTAKALAVVGRAARPLPIENLRCNGRLHSEGATYPAAGDAVFTFDYRVRDGAGSAAGELPAGVPIGAKPTREGPFLIEIWSGGGPTLVRTITLASDATDTTGATYTNADNAADHGGTPVASFEARVYCQRGALAGRRRTITVTKV